MNRTEEIVTQDEYECIYDLLNDLTEEDTKKLIQILIEREQQEKEKENEQNRRN